LFKFCEKQFIIADVFATVQVTEDDVIAVYQRLLWSTQNTIITKQYALLSLTKLSTRFQAGNE